MHRVVQPETWAKPRGYANGMLAEGRLLSVAGQIGWNERCEFVTDDFVEQFAQALDNVLAVVAAAGGSPEHLISMTVFVTDLPAYRAAGKALAEVWRPRLGRHFPTMALLGVSGFVEPRARVEITALAVLPPEGTR
jgi:enamine deaminase RidA (YjgF/YER057c/UK114 family)